ncbi:hypothetical protein FHX37_2814 [Haloactinospora alba]|uniref:Uncharacterized protein n=1 Tax=Haloactinospora alba TaxID=405555 RepID=A0A543NLX9_9ACTN|nr:hypothetical protein FHX37_2814 [Haloactinospora alba]
MVAGDVTEGDGFVLWGTGASASFQRILGRREAIGDDSITAGDICWLCNTSSGDALGERILHEDG